MKFLLEPTLPLIDLLPTMPPGVAEPSEGTDSSSGLTVAGMLITIFVTLLGIISLGLLIFCCVSSCSNSANRNRNRKRKIGKEQPITAVEHTVKKEKIDEESIVVAPISDDIETPLPSAPMEEGTAPQVVTTTIEHEDGSITEQTEITYANGRKTINIKEKQRPTTAEAFVISVEDPLQLQTPAIDRKR